MFALTRRLTLRPGWPEDAPALAAAIAHEAVVTRLSRAPWPYALSDAQAFLASPRDAHTPLFQILRRADNRLVGGIGLLAEAHGDFELGYWLTPDVWGRGYATEAGRAVLAIARDTLRLGRVRAHHHLDNPASGRVLRKLGFRQTGLTRLPSLARGGEVESAALVLDLDAPCEDGPRPMAIAA